MITLLDDPMTKAGRANSALEALFAPNAVAIVGASDDARKYGNWIAVQALKGDRPVHLVNRSRPTVLGQPTVPSISAVGAQVDLAVIAVPAAGFEAAVEDALDSGALAIVGISAGLGEAGEEGRRVQDRVTAKVRAAGARMLGAWVSKAPAGPLAPAWCSGRGRMFGSAGFPMRGVVDGVGHEDAGVGVLGNRIWACGK